MVLGSSAFNLQHLTKLRSCRISLHMREMCVPGSQSLPWVVTLITQLKSPSLEEVILVIKADDMSDLSCVESVLHDGCL